MDVPQHCQEHTGNTGFEKGESNEQLVAVDSNPISIVHNLGRFHKIKPMYTIERKVGKNLEVSLSLGNETWLGKGKDKKSANKDAAEKAIANTSLEIPKQKYRSRNMKALTPTVKLNGLLMSRGQSYSYTLISKNDVGIQACVAPMQLQSNETTMLYQETLSNYHIQDNDMQLYNQDDFQQIPSFESYYNWPTATKFTPEPFVFKMGLDIDEMTFIGEGQTVQAAKHAAAEKALTFLENQTDSHTQSFESVLKSEVSTLYEVAAAHNMKVKFTLTNENGPAHLKQYIMQLEVGTFTNNSLDTRYFNVMVTESGSSKKIAKRRAAISALKKMDALPQVTRPDKDKKQQPLKGKDWAATLHPVSRLLQIMQAKKLPNPVYRLVDTVTLKEKKVKFVFECIAQNETVLGEGLSKKEAKKVAAESMLLKLGYRQGPVPNIGLQPSKSSLKGNDVNGQTDRKLHIPTSVQRKVSFAKS